MFPNIKKYWDSYVQTLTYGKNPQTRRLTGTIPFNVIILRELPSEATFDRLSCPASDMPRDVTPRDMPRQPLHQIVLIKHAVSSGQSRIQPRCNCDLDKNVGQEPTFKVGDNVRMDRPQLARHLCQILPRKLQIDNITSFYAEHLDSTEYPLSNGIQ